MVSNYEGDYFKGIKKELKNKDHPELTHKKMGNHPGKNWYLKTVCVKSDFVHLDQIGYGILWNNIATENSDIAKIVQIAYDWNGNIIPYMNSVWLDKNYDIIVNYADTPTGLEILIVDRYSGHEYYNENLKTLINVIRESNRWKSKPVMPKKEIDEIEKIYDTLNDDLKSIDVELIERNFKIIYGGKN